MTVHSETAPVVGKRRFWKLATAWLRCPGARAQYLGAVPRWLFANHWGGTGDTFGDFCILEGVSRSCRNLIENKADLAFCIWYCLSEELTASEVRLAPDRRGPPKRGAVRFMRAGLASIAEH
jgi:hypothetical protein